MSITINDLADLAIADVVAADRIIIDNSTRATTGKGTPQTVVGAAAVLASSTTPTASMLVPIVRDNGDGSYTLFSVALSTLVSALPTATESVDGLMSAEDKTLLDGNAFGSRFVDGGRSDSVYTEPQEFDGGGAIADLGDE